MKFRKKRFLALALALVFVVSAALSFLALAEDEEKTPPVLIPYQRDAAAERSYEKVAEAFGMTLLVDANHAAIQLVDTDGNLWSSTPADYDADELANGEAKLAMASLLRMTYANRTGNLTTLNAYAEAVSKGNYGYTTIENGVRFDFFFEKVGITVPVTFTLTQDGLEASVLNSGIYEADETFKLISLQLLPYFGAAKSSDEGYLMIPDGGGALVEYKTAKNGAADYVQPVYGEEPVVTNLTAPEKYEKILLPVFGLAKNTQGYLAVLTKGAARGILHAEAAGNLHSFFAASAEFLYRNYDIVLVEKKNQNVRVISKTHTAEETFTVSYRFLGSGKADYMGMAESYRDYLTEYEGLKKQASDSESLFLSLVGGAKATVNVMGFPARQVQKFTTYTDALQLAKSLKAAGVENFSFQYLYWQKGGDSAPILTTLSPENTLGGKKDFLALIDYCNEQEIGLYPEVDPVNMLEDSLGFFGQSDGVKNVQKGAAKQFTYRLSDSGANTTMPYYLLSHAKVLSVCQSISDDRSKNFANLEGIGGSVLGNTVYSDLGNRNIQRDAAEALWAEALTTLKGEGSLLLSAPAGYALSLADAICDLPVESSGFDIETSAIPFYALVVRGMMPASSVNINTASDPDARLRLCLSLGLTPKFQTLMENEGQVAKTELDHVFNGTYDTWKNEMLRASQLSSLIMNATKGKCILSYEKTENGVWKTVYEGGVVVYVNDTDEVQTVDGLDVPVQTPLILENQPSDGEGDEA